MSNEFQLYNKVIELPLFKGLPQHDLENIVAHTKIGFETYEERDYIITRNQASNKLFFLLNGEVEICTTAANNAYVITEEVQAPMIFQPEVLFGLNQRFTKDMKASKTCQMMNIEKTEVMRLFNQYIIFKLNFLNLLSTIAQRTEIDHLQLPPTSLPQRIIRFIAQRCFNTEGRKAVKIKMNQLALEVNTKRLYISQALHQLENKHLVKLERNFIHIPDLEKAIKNA